jgi:rare lipoprotein A (peptidoglycan hydrolase)
MALFAILTSALSVLAAPAKPALPAPGVVSTPTPGGAARGSVGALPVLPSALPGVGLASWYPMRPWACWDASGRHPLPTGLKAFTATRGLPCGTMVRVSGPAGTITVPSEDFGPEAWTGRVLDLSPAAFIAVAGGLGSGVVPVSWWPA